MFQNFRLSMAWLHTWFGLVLGFVLMVVFFFGSLSVFDREIDRWAIPESRFAPQPMPSFDKMLLPVFQDMKPTPQSIEQARGRVNGPMAERFPVVKNWAAYTTHRDPVLSLFSSYELPNAKDPEDGVFGARTIDPRSGKSLPDDHLKIGSQFFYPLHYSLQLEWMNLGYFIVGFAALVMLVALVSGVVMHRKIFRELFTFRPKKHTQRSTLDLHNLTGVVALPFHFIFAFSGLVIFGSIYFPITETQLHPLHEMHEKHEALETGLPHDRAGTPAPLASVDAMVAEAKRRWAAKDMAGDVGLLNVQHVGDANSYVSVYRAGTDRIALTGEGIHFKASTGEVLREDPPLTPVASVNTFLTGLHLQHFRHWLLRWLYVLGGLSGCVCIATGFIFFVEKRKRQHAKQGRSGARWVDAFAVSTVTGMLVAALAMLIANRLLPGDLPARGDWERYIFWGAWVLAFAHGIWRTSDVAQARIAPAWAEQCVAVAVMAVAAVLLNWVTTGDHLLRTVGAGYWPVAGVDLFMLASAALALMAARKLRRRAGAPVVAAVFRPAPAQAVVAAGEDARA
ncbi:PepSY-associated TM helix domain-containing protein [Variovorax sp. J22G73]|uniref:PepSY-associated TM helix domain-containing protein n=1 Tax=unclassified Variovorax TaxID=663243 RepID=UPI002577B644|nr:MULTISPECIES: PepSY-associated TM helix domain-containing protein [unclassified Variovorax]MDM0004898.1 PepSY-associated TM helix domain-containing protein [Variovorax sp. J22R203]MDM0098314.1 PepSY-associated TM helix domain-containing protein [Variovorax sp. J22G73]